MKHAIRTAATPLLHLLLVCSLVFSPLAHARLMAMTAPAEGQAPSPCAQHAAAPDASPQEAPDQDGGCCSHGAGCHCAMALTLPAAPLPVMMPEPAIYRAVVPRLPQHLPPPPETPPPRA